MGTVVNDTLSSHSLKGDPMLLGETDNPVVGGLMIPKSADLGEDGASGIRVSLAVV